MTYDQMAAELGLSNARAQQLVRVALLKFTKRWNSFFPNDPLPLPKPVACTCGKQPGRGVHRKGCLKMAKYVGFGG